MSINVVVSSTAAGVSVSGGTAVAIEVGGGIGPAGFITAPGTATNAFGTFQLVSGDGVTITTNAGQFVIASYSTTQAASFAPVQSVAGRTGAVTIARADLTAAAEVHTHSTADIVSFTAAASAAAPVQSVAGRTGTISLAAADVSGLAAVATSGSYTSLSEIPVEFTPATHTHDYAATSHTHAASDITSGTLDFARIPAIGYTALAGVPTSFAPEAHTHSTADITGYSAIPAQAGANGPLVTDGTAATWATRYSVVDPVLVEGAGMTLSRDTAAGSITVAFAGGTSGIVVSSATPQPLGTAAAGVAGNAAREDHVHTMPSAADVGAASAVHTHVASDITDFTSVANVISVNGLTGVVTVTGGVTAASVTTKALTVDENDYDAGSSDIVRLTPSANVTLTGLAGGSDGVVRVLYNIGTHIVTLATGNTNSAETNRFSIVSGSVILDEGDSASAWYDGTSQRWRVLEDQSSGGSGGGIAMSYLFG